MMTMKYTCVTLKALLWHCKSYHLQVSADSVKTKYDLHSGIHAYIHKASRQHRKLFCCTQKVQVYYTQVLYVCVWSQ